MQRFYELNILHVAADVEVIDVVFLPSRGDVPLFFRCDWGNSRKHFMPTFETKFYLIWMWIFITTPATLCTFYWNNGSACNLRPYKCWGYINRGKLVHSSRAFIAGLSFRYVQMCLWFTAPEAAITFCLRVGTTACDSRWYACTHGTVLKRSRLLIVIGYRCRRYGNIIAFRCKSQSQVDICRKCCGQICLQCAVFHPGICVRAKRIVTGVEWLQTRVAGPTLPPATSNSSWVYTLYNPLQDVLLSQAAVSSPILW